VFDVYVDVDVHMKLYVGLKVSPSIAFLQFLYCNVADWKHLGLKGTEV